MKSNIDVLKPHLVEIIELGAEIQKAAADKKIRFGEAINIVIEARDLTGLIKTRAAVKKAITSLTEAEGIQLAKELNSVLYKEGITKANGRKLIESTINVWIAVDAWFLALEGLKD